MSDSDSTRAGGDPRALDHLRHHAKRLLQQARAGDTVVLARLRALLRGEEYEDESLRPATVRVRSTDIQ